MRNLTRGASFAAVLTCVAAIAAPAHGQATTGGASPPTAAATTATPAPSTTPAPAPATGTAVETRTVKLTPSQTKTVQRRVKVRADGAMGSRTRSAIRRYQARKKLKRTGRPNIQTLRAMKLRLAEKLAAEANRSAPAPAPDAAPTAGSAAKAIAAARKAIGTPYGSGGNGPDTYDCSGLTVMAYEAAGITLPRTSFVQFKEGTAVEKSAIQPGDLVFFDTAGPGASHVGVATSATKVISATTSGVREHRIDDSYWGSHYMGARRVIG